MEERRGLSGNHIIRKKEAAREILRALGAGDAVGILIDQNTSASEGVFIDFFGVKACAGTAFVKFAHHTGAAVVPGFAVWSDAEKQYVLHFYPEVPMSGDVQEDTQRVHSVLERLIASIPTNGYGFTGGGRPDRRENVRFTKCSALQPVKQ